MGRWRRRARAGAEAQGEGTGESKAEGEAEAKTPEQLAAEAKRKAEEERAQAEAERAKLRIQPYTVRFADWIPFRSLNARVKRCKIADQNDCEKACAENGQDCRDVTLTRACKVLCTRDRMVPPSAVGQIGFGVPDPPYGVLGPLSPGEDAGGDGGHWDLGEALEGVPDARISTAIDRILGQAGEGIGVAERRTDGETATREELVAEYMELRAKAVGYEAPMYHACRVVDPSGELVFLLAELSLFEEPPTEDGYPGDVSVVNEVPIIPDEQRRLVLRLFDEYAAKEDPPPVGEGDTEVDEWYSAEDDPENPDLSVALAGIEAKKTAQSEKERRMVRMAVGGGVLLSILITAGIAYMVRKRKTNAGAPSGAGKGDAQVPKKV